MGIDSRNIRLIYKVMNFLIILSNPVENLDTVVRKLQTNVTDHPFPQANGNASLGKYEWGSCVGFSGDASLFIKNHAY